MDSTNIRAMWCYKAAMKIGHKVGMLSPVLEMEGEPKTTIGCLFLEHCRDSLSLYPLLVLFTLS